MAEICQGNGATQLMPDVRYKYGMYVYRNRNFVNKLDVLDYALSVGDTNPVIRYYFHDHVYCKLTKEPDVSLNQLYVNRAKQLRDTYDYIILLYSGGSDSHEILNVFLNNDIFLDEVQNLHPKKLTDGKIDTSKLEQYGNDVLAEHVVTALPALKRLSELSPKTKIRILDTTDSFFDIGDNYISTYYNHFFNTFYSTQMNTAILDKENVELATKKKVCLLWGNDKPYVGIDLHNNFFYGFHDVQRQFSPWLRDNNRSPIHFECFFWSIDAPLIQVKQSHAIMKRIQMDLDVGNRYSYNLFRSKNGVDQNMWMRDVIYQYWDNNTYQAKANVRDWYTMDQNIIKFVPRIRNVTEDKKNFYTEKYKSLGGSVDLSKPGLGMYRTQTYNIGKVELM